ncbi:hypothetical protein [Actinomadura sp. HBU206391]|uniref:hypothetical protein n=1 Tax=Actinomadura sp. HBU206391 TaxID=2731692 RepID=UPI001650ACE4|nr:hypothetical protein [Actinomadura sp. HBU206391]MBC6456368.1 hypothetical protein [Actinomadura sp. HBU206391]
MPRVPPLVRSARAGGIAYLLRWEWEGPHRWAADIAWVEWNGQDWTPCRTHVPASDITPLPGQKYKSVSQIKRVERERDERLKASRDTNGRGPEH